MLGSTCRRVVARGGGRTTAAAATVTAACAVAVRGCARVGVSPVAAISATATVPPSVHPHGAWQHAQRAQRDFTTSSAPPRPLPSSSSSSDRHLDIVYMSGTDVRRSTFIVINKPAGLAVQARAPLDSIEHRLRTLHGCSRGVWFPHRIDKHTSGLLVVALSKQVCGVLSRQIEAQQWIKEYRVVATIPPPVPCELAPPSSRSSAAGITLPPVLQALRSPYLRGHAFTSAGLLPHGEFQSLLVRRRLPTAAHTAPDPQREWQPWEATLDANGSYVYSDSVSARSPSFLPSSPSTASLSPPKSHWRFHPFVPENMLYHSVPKSYRTPKDVDPPKHARTSYRLIAQSAATRAALYHATLHTGRSHQLRLHFAEAGLPIVADPYYNPYHIVARLVRESSDSSQQQRKTSSSSSASTSSDRTKQIERQLATAAEQSAKIGNVDASAEHDSNAPLERVSDAALHTLLTSTPMSLSATALPSLKLAQDLVQRQSALRLLGTATADPDETKEHVRRPRITVYRSDGAMMQASSTAHTEQPRFVRANNGSSNTNTSTSASASSRASSHRTFQPATANEYSFEMLDEMDDAEHMLDDDKADSVVARERVDAEGEQDEEDESDNDDDDDDANDWRPSVQAPRVSRDDVSTREAKMSRAMRAYFASHEALRNLPATASSSSSPLSTSPSASSSPLAPTSSSHPSSTIKSSSSTASSKRHPSLQGPSFFIMNFSTVARWFSSWSQSSSSSRSSSSRPSASSSSSSYRRGPSPSWSDQARTDRAHAAPRVRLNDRDNDADAWDSSDRRGRGRGRPQRSRRADDDDVWGSSDRGSQGPTRRGGRNDDAVHSRTPDSRSSRRAQSPTPSSSSSSSSSRAASTTSPLPSREQVAQEWADVLQRFRVQSPMQPASESFSPSSSPASVPSSSLPLPRTTQTRSSTPARSTTPTRDVSGRRTPRTVDELRDDVDAMFRELDAAEDIRNSSNDRDDNDAFSTRRPAPRSGVDTAAARASTTGVTSDYVSARSSRKLEKLLEEEEEEENEADADEDKEKNDERVMRVVESNQTEREASSGSAAGAFSDRFENPHADYSDSMWVSKQDRSARNTSKSMRRNDSDGPRGVGAIGWWVHAVEQQREQQWLAYQRTRSGLTRRQEEVEDRVHDRHVAALRLARQLEHEQVEMGLQAFVVDFPHPERSDSRVRIELPLPDAWRRAFPAADAVESREFERSHVRSPVAGE